ncbi:MAG: hypothetical protein K6G50_11940 [bacterium]|nr:hypothetical protein [bacterium]
MKSEELASVFREIAPGAYKLKGRPFRLGTDSCVFEADLVENVQKLAPFFDDVMLILYDCGVSNYPDSSQVKILKDIAQAQDLSYTVHLPSALHGIEVSKAWEESCYAQVMRSIETTSELAPQSFVWHWESESFGEIPSDDIPRWLDALRRLASRVLSSSAVEPEKLCVETLSYPFGIILPMVREFGLSVTLDIGHVWKAGWPPAPLLNELLPMTRIAHIHGLLSGEDHRSLAAMPGTLVKEFLEAWTGFPEKTLPCGLMPQERTLTIEVFSPEDLRQSADIIVNCVCA